MTPAQLFVQFLTQCERGFDNEHHWREWKKKHAAEIDMLPVPLKKRVLIAWEQATSKEFSGGPSARLSRGLNGSDAEAGPPLSAEELLAEMRKARPSTAPPPVLDEDANEK